MTLQEARDRIGAGVVYTPYPGGPKEDGTIARVGDRYVMVLYVGDHTPKATRADDLEFLADWQRA